MITPNFRDFVLDLLENHVEKEWFEVKFNQADPAVIGRLFSALSNSAADTGNPCSYVVWGIDDTTNSIIGTDFVPSEKKVGNQEFSLWLAQRLSPSIRFEFQEGVIDSNRLVLCKVDATTSAPVSFEGTPYIRIGSATPKLADYPDRAAALITRMRPSVWERGIAVHGLLATDATSLFDYPQYFRMLRLPSPDGNVAILERLAADDLVVREIGGRWGITNLGAILFAVDLRGYATGIDRKGVRVVKYGGVNRASTVTHRYDGKRGYASSFEEVIDYVNALLPANEHIGEALRVEERLFPELAIRELIANALIHQDMTISGAGPLIEIFDGRIEISNPGEPLVPTDRMVDLPPRSRNELLASLMRRMRLCEEQGSGLDKVISEVEIFQLPPPLFRAGEASTQVILYGPREFSEMSAEERVRACYQHAVLKFLSGDRMRNSSLCERLGIARRNAAQASGVIRSALDSGAIRPADPEHPRAGYVPGWA